MSTKGKTPATAKTKTTSPKATKSTSPKAKSVTTKYPKATTPKAKTPATAKSKTPATPKASSTKATPKTAKVYNRNTVAVVQFTPRGRRIRKYNSIAEAQRATGVNTGSISKAVRGIVKTAGGFVWTNNN